MKVVQEENDWLILVDLLDAYLHVPIRKQHQKFLRFAVCDQHDQFTCLPFGICTVPRVFSKILLSIISLIRLEGIQIYHYLDDIIVLGDSAQQLSEHRDGSF